MDIGSLLAKGFTQREFYTMSTYLIILFFLRALVIRMNLKIEPLLIEKTQTGINDNGIIEDIPVLRNFLQCKQSAESWKVRAMLIDGLGTIRNCEDPRLDENVFSGYSL